ncbi:ribose ABC transporter permease RbsC [Klebsiella pneumoniae]|nr:ribose ABC transporter permease RbsC [Klebsiella pneumoniae]
MNQKYMIYMYLLKARTFIALLLVIAFFSVMVPNFLTASNLLIMTQHVAITGLLAIGMTLVILTGGIDLSVGAVAGICGMVAGALLTNGLPLWNGDILFFNVPEVILCVAIFGVLVGLVNGAVITRFGVAPFICTLGMMYVARGSALLFNDGSTYPNLNGMEALGNTGFATLGSGTLLGVYLPIWLMIGFLVLGYWLTTKTPLGRYIYAIGGNESAARLAGVPIVKAKIFVYAFSGLCAAFVGLIVASQLQTAHPMTGNMFEMDAIGATVLGGTALAGGRGRVTGSIIGAFVIVFLADGMVMMGVSDFWQMVIKGVVIVTAVVVDQFQQKLQSKVILMRRHEEKLAAIPPQRRHLQLTGNDSHLPPGLVPGSAKGKNMQRDFQNKTVVITGACRGIGAGIAERFARDGANLVMVSNAERVHETAETLRQRYQADILSLQVDVTDEAQVQSLYEQAAARFGTIDVSIQNAGVITIDYYDRMPKADFEKVLAVNTTGVWLCCREAAKYMVKQNHGSLINTSSGQGRQGFIYTPHYAASKMGVIGITQSLAHELAPWNITVNAFCPGIIESEMWDYNDRVWGEILGTEQKRYGKGELMAEWVEGIPMKRAGKPEDVAGLVAFLASDDARYLTGQTINIDGGLIMS